MRSAAETTCAEESERRQLAVSPRRGLPSVERNGGNRRADDKRVARRPAVLPKGLVEGRKLLVVVMGVDDDLVDELIEIRWIPTAASIGGLTAVP